MYVRKRKGAGTLGTSNNKERFGGTNSFKGGVSQRNYQNLHNVPFNYGSSSSLPSQGTQQSTNQRPPPFKSLLQGNSGNPGSRDNAFSNKRNAGSNMGRDNAFSNKRNAGSNMGRDNRSQNESMSRENRFQNESMGRANRPQNESMDRNNRFQNESMGRDNRFQNENMGRDNRYQNESVGRDNRSQNENFGRDHSPQNKDRFNKGRTFFGVQQDRLNQYDQRQNANRAPYIESQSRNEGMSIQNSLFGQNFRYGNTPFANMLTVDALNSSNNTQINQGNLSHSGRRDDSYRSEGRDDVYQSDRGDYAYSDRRRDPSPDRRREPSPDRRLDPSPDRRLDPSPFRRHDPSPVRRHDPSPERRRDLSPNRRGHFYPDRRGDSFPERNHGGYSGRRDGSPSPERGSFGYHHDRRDSDYPDRRYDFHSDRGRTHYQDERDGDLYRDRRDSDSYYPEKIGGDGYSDGRDSPYGDRRGNSSYGNPISNQDRPGSSHYSDQRRMDSTRMSRQSQSSNNLDNPRGHVYSSRDGVVELDSFENRSSQSSSRSQRVIKGRSYEEINRGRYQDPSPSKDEKQAAMGIFQKLIAKQQKTLSSSGIPVKIDDANIQLDVDEDYDIDDTNVQIDEDDNHSFKVNASKRKRNLRAVKRRGMEFQNKQHLVEVSDLGLPQSKKQRLSVMSRLGPKLGFKNQEITTRLQSKSGKNNPRPKSEKIEPSGEKKKLGVKARLSIPKEMEDNDFQKKFTTEDYKMQAMKYKDLPAQILNCTKCAKDKFGSVNAYLQHKLEPIHNQADTSFQEKMDVLHQYIVCDNKIKIAHKFGAHVFNNFKKKIPDCDICGAPTYKLCQFNASKVVHQYTMPGKCCQKGNYKKRIHIENHLLSLGHLKKFSDEFIKMKEVHQEELNNLELVKEAYLSGSETPTDKDGIEMTFRYQASRRRAKIYQFFGTVPLPKEVSGLLRAMDDVSHPPGLTPELSRTRNVERLYYNPSNVHGLDPNISFETNLKCELCGIMLERSQNSLIDHCSTKLHYDNIVKEQQRRLRKKELEVIVKGDRKIAKIVWDDGDDKKKDEENENSDSDIYGSHHNKGKEQKKILSMIDEEETNVVMKSEKIENADIEKTEKTTRTDKGLTEKTQKANNVKKSDEKKSKEAIKARTTHASRTKVTENIKTEEEANKVEEETNNLEEEVDMDSDPYGGNALLGIEEEQEEECGEGDTAEEMQNIEKEAKKEVEDEGEQLVEDEAEKEVEDEAEKEVEDEAAKEVEDKVEKNIEDEVEEHMEDEMVQSIEGEAEQDVEDEGEKPMEGEMEQDIEDDAEPNVKDETDQDIEAEMEQGVEDEVEEEVEDEAEGYVEDEAEEDVQDEAEEDVQDEAEEDIQDEGEEYGEDEAEEDVQDEEEEYGED